MICRSDGLVLGYAQLSSDLLSLSSQYLYLLSIHELRELSSRRYVDQLRISHYIFGRLFLKSIISCELGIDPRSISITSLGTGRPSLVVNGLTFDACSVSVSHFQSRLLVLFSTQNSFGVDVQILNGIDWSAVIRFMSWHSHVARIRITTSQFGELLTDHVCAAILWAAYESWMKATSCNLDASLFFLQDFRPLISPSASSRSFYAARIPSSLSSEPSSVVISLAHNEVLAVTCVRS